MASGARFDSNRVRQCGQVELWPPGSAGSLAAVVALAYPQGYNSPAPSSTAASPMEQPLQLLAEANRTFQGIRDYTCLFVKREQIRGQLQPDNLVALKVRTQPFSVYLRGWGPRTWWARKRATSPVATTA